MAKPEINFMPRDFVDRMVEDDRNKRDQWNKDNPPLFTQEVVIDGIPVIYGLWKFENGDVGFITKYLKDKPFNQHAMIVLPASIILLLKLIAK